jgi:hypothetical protein
VRRSGGKPVAPEKLPAERLVVFFGKEKEVVFIFSLAGDTNAA